MAFSDAKAILFDLDGTLLDSFASHLSAYQAAFAKLGLQLTEAEFHRCYHPDWNLFYRAAHVPAGRWETLSACWREEVAMRQTPPPYPGIRAALEVLARHADLGVVTSGSRHRVNADLKGAGLVSLFGVIITGDDIGAPKPAPDGVRLALRALGVPPAEALFVGDTPVDEEMADRAGVRFIGVASAFAAGRFTGVHPPLTSVVTLPGVLGWM